MNTIWNEGDEILDSLYNKYKDTVARRTALESWINKQNISDLFIRLKTNSLSDVFPVISILTEKDFIEDQRTALENYVEGSMCLFVKILEQDLGYSVIDLVGDDAIGEVITRRDFIKIV